MSLILATLPFLYTQRFRYYQGKKLLGYVLGDFLPIALYVYFRSAEASWLQFLLLWAFFWGFYEIGYLFNDCRSVRFESLPSERAPAEICQHLGTVVGLRSLYLTGLFYLGIRIGIEPIRLALTTLFVALVFTLHNRLRSYETRFLTLTVLGVLKLVYLPFVLEVPVADLLLVSLPALVVKYCDYLFAKGIASHDFRRDGPRTFLLFLLWTPVVAGADPMLLCVWAPIFVQFNKRYLLEVTRAGLAAR